VKWWELDLGWYWIKLFRAFGLAKVLYTGPIVERVPGRSVVDMDTVWAVLNDRFHVMANYAERVVAPLVEQEYTAPTSRPVR
jgi:stearoyl-CoA desaturase (Delta-9 desaturase)